MVSATFSRFLAGLALDGAESAKRAADDGADDGFRLVLARVQEVGPLAAAGRHILNDGLRPLLPALSEGGLDRLPGLDEELVLDCGRHPDEVAGRVSRGQRAHVLPEDRRRLLERLAGREPLPHQLLLPLPLLDRSLEERHDAGAGELGEDRGRGRVIFSTDAVLATAVAAPMPVTKNGIVLASPVTMWSASVGFSTATFSISHLSSSMPFCGQRVSGSIGGETRAAGTR
jgi:hypothetical protein